MKTKHLLLGIAAIFVLVSCEKDSDIDPIQTNGARRIKQIINENVGNGWDWKTVFTYEGEKLANYIDYYKDNSGIWKENYKHELSYAGDTATVRCYNKYTGGWVLDEKHKYVIQNGLMMEDLDSIYYTNGTLSDILKWTYQYSGANITSWQSYSLNNYDYSFKQDGKGEYSYQNGRLSEFINYKTNWSGEFYPYEKSSFSTNDSSLIIINYRMDVVDSWSTIDKYEYHYSGDTLSQRKNFYWVGDQWESASSESYTYSNEGDIVELRYSNGDTFTFEYEDGKGNAKLFYYSPEYLVYGRPTLRSASTTKNHKYIPYHERLNGLLH